MAMKKSKNKKQQTNPIDTLENMKPTPSPLLSSIPALITQQWMIHSQGNGLLLGFAQEFEDLLSLYPIGFCSNAIHKNGFGRMGKDLNHCFGEQYIRGNHAGEAKRDVCKNQVTFVITNVSGC